MLPTAFYSLIASILVPALATAELPLQFNYCLQDEHPTIFSDKGPTEWTLDEPGPNPDTTDHFVFNTVYSLLQHWPNTYMSNGHAVVLGIIPMGTLLYHYTDQNKLPPGPEWVSIDPEHAYLYCWMEPESWYLTLTTTRPLKIVYFDGSSADKFPDGSLDSQDLIIWEESRPENVFDELRRIQDLCEWVQKFSMDGVVRMGMAFEVMLCDFTSGVSATSFTNIIHAEVNNPQRRVLFEAIFSGSWHDRFPGESRVLLDLAGLVTFYDTGLVPSLVAGRAGQERWEHRVRDISSEDLLAVKSRLEETMVQSPVLSSGIDWRALARVIVDRFAGRLELTHRLLSSLAIDQTTGKLLDLAHKTQTQLRIMLIPYIPIFITPTDPTENAGSSWARPIYKHCATAHTASMESELGSVTDSERLILQAMQGTTREICRVVTRMWAAGISAGIDSSLSTKEPLGVAEVTHVWNSWREDLHRLMAWLDWSLWMKCNPSCGPEEMCMLFRLPFQSSAIHERPRPQCINRVDPSLNY